MANLIESSFKPAWWLRSPHLQTVGPSLTRRRKKLSLEWERLELRDGDFIELAWHRSDGPLVMLIHGLEGSLDSHYATPMMKSLTQAGFSSLFMHLRGCGSTPNRLDRSYHSGATEDLAEVLELLDQRNARPAAVVGFSLGGNLHRGWPCIALVEEFQHFRQVSRGGGFLPRRQLATQVSRRDWR